LIAKPVLALTGGTGFIGSALGKRLVAAGWNLRALVRSPERSNRLKSLGIEVVIGDLSQRPALELLVAGVNAVIHCAGAVRGRGQSDFIAVNVHGVARLAEAAALQESVPRFLLLSSLAARAPELSHYAESKRLGEDALRAVAGTTMEWCALRPSAVYGPGDRELLPLLRSMALGIGPRLGPAAARFSMLYVDDLAAAVEAWLGAGQPVRGVFELHDGRENGYSWEEAAQIVAALDNRRSYSVRIPRSVLQLAAWVSLGASRLSGQAPMLSPGKVRELTHLNWVCDNTAFNRATGWSPKVQLPMGARRTLRSLA